MEIKKYTDLPVFDKALPLEAYKLFSNGNEVIHMILKPDEQIEPHEAEGTVLFFVLEGMGLFQIGTETVQTGKYTMVESPKGVTHSIKNSEPVDLHLLIIKLQ